MSKYVADQLEDAVKRLAPVNARRAPAIPEDLQHYLDSWVIPVIQDVISYERKEMGAREFKHRNWG